MARTRLPRPRPGAHYDESPEILRYLEKWQAPTKQHIPDQADNYRPVPEAYACGLPAMQTQHTCILLQDIVEHCNLRCPSSGAHMLVLTHSWPGVVVTT